MFTMLRPWKKLIRKILFYICRLLITDERSIRFEYFFFLPFVLVWLMKNVLHITSKNTIHYSIQAIWHLIITFKLHWISKLVIEREWTLWLVIILFRKFIIYSMDLLVSRWLKLENRIWFNRCLVLHGVSCENQFHGKSILLMWKLDGYNELYSCCSFVYVRKSFQIRGFNWLTSIID